MSDSRNAEPSLTIKHYITMFETVVKQFRVVYRRPTVELRVKSSFAGPFQKNWLYISMLAYAQTPVTETYKYLPYQCDAVTVEGLEDDKFASHTNIWTVSEDLYGYRSWNNAKKCIVSMSGAQYGGVATVLSVEGKHTIRTQRRYEDWIYSESVHLIPMVPARVLGCDMDMDGIEVVFEINHKDVFVERDDDNPDNPANR
jgi:hypothetical protein